MQNFTLVKNYRYYLNMQVLVQYRWVLTKHSYTVVVLQVYRVKSMQDLRNHYMYITQDAYYGVW